MTGLVENTQASLIYNLVGEKNISNKSFINCYKLVEKIYKNRMTNDYG